MEFHLIVLHCCCDFKVLSVAQYGSILCWIAPLLAAGLHGILAVWKYLSIGMVDAFHICKKKKKLSSKERGIKKDKEMILRDIKIMHYTCLTYPLVIPVPGQVPFGAVVISNLLVTSSFVTEKKNEVISVGDGLLRTLEKTELAAKKNCKTCNNTWKTEHWPKILSIKNISWAKQNLPAGCCVGIVLSPIFFVD